MAKGDLGSLIATGITLGVVHVLTGPDHLSALATLSANVNNHLEAAFLGIRWGIGHSSGLLLVGTILILLSNAGQKTVDMPDYATHVFESIVGIFMLLLGFYGVRKAWLKRPTTHYNVIDESDSSSPVRQRHSYGEQQLQELEQDGIMNIGGSEEGRIASDGQEEGLSPDNNNDDDNDINNDSTKSLEIYLDGDDSPVCVPPPIFGQWDGDDQDGNAIVAIASDESDLEEAVVAEQAYLGTVSPYRCRRFLDALSNRISAKTIAFLAGIVHGLAGPGGVLGVIPAVQLQNWKLAAIYLSCFCVSSTITMGCFATLYAACSSKIVRGGAHPGREFWIECLSAALSIIVGITWLTLLSLGKLEDVFP